MIPLFLFPQSYVLYICGDENATSTEASKYLLKLSAGMVVFLSFHICLFLSRLFVPQFGCVCVYWQPAIITCQSNGFLLQGPATQKERLVTHIVCHLISSVSAMTKTQYSTKGTSVPAGIWSALFPPHRIGHWLCGWCESIQSDSFLSSAVFCHFFSHKTKPDNNNSHPT